MTLQAWWHLPRQVGQLVALLLGVTQDVRILRNDLAALRRHLGAPEVPPSELVEALDCGHLSAAIVTDPRTGRRVCPDCAADAPGYRAQRAAVRAGP